jgi:hypothetical protein
VLKPFDYRDPSNAEMVHEVAWFKWEEGRTAS